MPSKSRCRNFWQAGGSRRGAVYFQHVAHGMDVNSLHGFALKRTTTTTTSVASWSVAHDNDASRCFLLGSFAKRASQLLPASSTSILGTMSPPFVSSESQGTRKNQRRSRIRPLHLICPRNFRFAWAKTLLIWIRYPRAFTKRLAPRVKKANYVLLEQLITFSVYSGIVSTGPARPGRFSILNYVDTVHGNLRRMLT